MHCGILINMPDTCRSFLQNSYNAVLDWKSWKYSAAKIQNLIFYLKTECAWEFQMMHCGILYYECPV